ncbi:MAG: tetraacyldisaccharide 4'-kinase [Candidatus Binatia bacterium]
MTLGQRFIRRVWQRQGLLGALGWLALTPLSLSFSSLVRSRNLLYNLRWLRAKQAPALKVISVGNLTVGGTGKTPLVLWLAQALQNRGHKVGILTRGYKGKNTGVTVVGTTGQSTAIPAEVGDETVMLARAFAGVVIAGRDRVAAARLAQERFGVEVVILDDGFQHRRLKRDIDLILVHGTTGVGNGWLLPAGPLREPVSATRRADVVIIAKGNKQENWARRIVKKGRPVFYGDLVPSTLISPVQRKWHELPLADLVGKRVVAITGVADPFPFYRSLQEWEVEVAEILEFPDHHAYTQADWQTISQAGQKFDLIVTTEKDLVKLEQFPFAAGKLIAVRVQMEIEYAEELLTLIERRLGTAETGEPLPASEEAAGERNEESSQ